ncbi:MAG: Rrf2 family transcriptional regulator [Verrucomicrobiaceae bacterium]|nr:Rrf2 family transcriptional regulator [Verrucomicrobiaceae bacterium]
MRISRKAEHALRALAAMARSPMGTTFLNHELSAAERIPIKMLEQVLVVLKNNGLLRSKRGAGGGYQLAVPPAQISLGQVVFPFDGAFDPVACTIALDKSGARCECGLPGGCPLARTFSSLRDSVRGWFNATTIADIIANDPPQEAVTFEI